MGIYGIGRLAIAGHHMLLVVVNKMLVEIGLSWVLGIVRVTH